MARLFAPLTTALALFASIPAAAQDGTWITSAAGAYNWSDAANWQSGVVADGAGHTANFTTAGLTGNVFVTMDTARTIGSLVFDDAFNVESQDGSTVWSETERDELPADRPPTDKS